MSDTVPTYLDESLREIYIGSISGSMGKIIEFPFDTIKVRLQYSQSLPSPIFNSTLDCIKKTYHNEGFINGFYKGLTSPLIGAALEFASLFWSYDLSKLILSNNSEELSIQYKMIAGGMSGLVTSFVLTPIELIKCQMQVNNLNKVSNSSLFHILKSIYQTQGITSFWKGQSSTLLRETGGTMFWFTTYELLTQHFKQNSPITSWQLLFSGACAGISYNLSFYPIDTIKSIIQTTNETNYLKILKILYQNGGIRIFYTGCGITILRAIPSNALVFFIYEKLKDLYNL